MAKKFASSFADSATCVKRFGLPMLRSMRVRAFKGLSEPQQMSRTKLNQEYHRV